MLQRGGREIGKAILKSGEQLNEFPKDQSTQADWERAFRQTGLNPEDYTEAIEFDQPLPWDFLYSGEKKRRLQEARTDMSAAASHPVKTFRPQPDAGVSETGKQQLYGRRLKAKASASSLGPAQSKVRMKWIKTEKVRFTSHLDAVRMFEKALRRADFSVGYSEGFHPHPKIAYGPPLPLGFVSECEYLDLQLETAFNYRLADRLNSTLPDGFRIIEARPVFAHSISLSSFVNTSVYEVQLERLSDSQLETLRRLPLQKEIMVSRKTVNELKTVNLAGLVHQIQVENSAENSLVRIWVGLGQQGYARPQEVLQYALQVSDEQLGGLVFKRTQLFFKKGDQYLAPLQVS
jgi:radical SAM-linked protein